MSFKIPQDFLYIPFDVVQWDFILLGIMKVTLKLVKKVISIRDFSSKLNIFI